MQIFSSAAARNISIILVLLFSPLEIQFGDIDLGRGCVSRFVQQTNFGSKLEVVLLGAAIKSAKLIPAGRCAETRICGSLVRFSQSGLLLLLLQNLQANLL
jgi:hypothetical protein